MNVSEAASAPELGRIGRSHGLVGAVRFHPVSSVAADIVAASDAVWIDGLGETRVISFARHGTSWLLRVADVRRVEDAKRRVDAIVRSVTPSSGAHDRATGGRGEGSLGKGGLGTGDLELGAPTTSGLPDVGFRVVVDGIPLGTVSGIFGPSLHAVARVATERGEVLIPLTAPYVRVDDTTVHVVHPPEGLLDLA